MPAASIVLALLVVLVSELVSGSGELAALRTSIGAILGIVLLVGLALGAIGVIGWLATADNWGDRFARLTRVGLIMIPASLLLAFSMAFATQDGTDVDGKLAVAAFFLLWTPITILIATFSYIGRRTYDRRAALDRT